MIPRTYPTTYVTANGKQQMVVFFLSSVSGLQRFKDYIPVSFPQYGNQKDNSYDNSGVVLVDVLSSSSGRQAWKDYIPVFVESNAADAWRVSINGYIPVGLATAPTLALDFTSSSETLDPRITFSRTSNATVTDSSGTLRFAPHNLLTFSEQFDNAAWAKNNGATVTANATTAPDGTITADQFNGAASSSTGVFRFPTTASNLRHTFSVYVKNSSGATSMRIGCDANPTNACVIFNASTGVITSSEANVLSSSVINMGNGWYRVLIDFTTTSTGPGLVIYNNTGVVSTWFTWGAQLNVSNMVGGVTSSLSTYYPTTVKNLLGFSEDFANAAWTKSNSFIQTNLLQRSEELATSPWFNSGLTSITNNTTDVTDPLGNNRATKLVVSGSAGVAGQSAGTLTADVYTGSVWLRCASGTVTGSLIVYLGGSPFTNIGTQAITITTQWQRFTVTSSTATAAAYNFQIHNLSGGTVYAWGAQFVRGSTPGDYQQSFSAAAPVMYRAPNGTLTADKLVEDTANSAHLITAGTPTVGQPQTFSIYAKAAERSRISIAGGGFTGQGFNAFFDLSNGTMALNAGNKGSITAVGGGWYRCAISFTPSNTVAYQVTLSDGTTTTYTGNGTSGVYIWGAQLSDSASLDTYVNNPLAAPSSTAYYGPRFDYNPTTLAPRGLLIEEQRTNSIRNNTMQGAVAGTPGTLPTNWTLVGVGGITSSVIGTGTENGINYIDIRINGTPTASSFINVIFDTGIAGASGQSWTHSTYVKLVGGTLTNTSVLIEIREVDGSGTFLANSTTTITPTASSLITQRASLTRTLNNASTTNVRPMVDFQTTNGLAIDVTLRIGLPQLEQGAFATSVIPTTTATATRNADVASITGSNFSGLYNQNEGSVYSDCARSALIPSGSFANLWSISDNTANERYIVYNTGSSGTMDVAVTDNSSGQATLVATGAITANSSIKTLFSYKVNDFAFVRAAGTVQTDTSGSIPTVDRLYIGANSTGGGQWTGTISKIAYYPKRLTNAEIQSITA